MYHKLKMLFLSLMLSSIGLISFYFSLDEKNMFVEQLNSTEVDINQQTVALAVDEFSASKFLYNFFFIDEFYYVYIVILFIIIGFFSTSTLLQYRLSGLGNLYVSREHYKKYLLQNIFHEIKKITFLIITSMALIHIFSFFIGNGYKDITIGDIQWSSLKIIYIFSLTTLLLILYILFAVVISMLVSMWLESIYLAYLLPLIMFLLIPVFIGSTLGNIFPLLGDTIKNIIPFIFLTSTSTILESNTDIAIYIFQTSIFFFLLLGITTILYKLNIKKFTETYI